MGALKYREIKRRYELDGAQKTTSHLAEALEQKHLRPEDFSLRDLAEALVPDGHQWVRSLDPRNTGRTNLLESGDGIDVTAFLNITGQVIYARMMEAYTQEAFVVSKLVETIPTRLDGEKIPGVARIADDIDEVRPGMPYPSLGFGEDYIETPSTSKRGFIVPVTKEAIFFDRTNLVLSRAAEVGELLGLTWGDIDFDAGVIRVRKQLDDETRARVEPKTEHAVRDVMLMPSLGRTLREHRLASPFSSDGDLVFCSPTGAGLDRHNV